MHVMTATLLLALGLVAAAPKPATSTASPGASGAAARPLVVLMDVGAAMSSEFRSSLLVALKREVERSQGFRWLEPPAISLDELSLALNCTGVDEACLRRAGENLKAEAVLLVSVGKAPRKELSVMLVTVTPVKPARTVGVPLTETATTLNDLRGALRTLLGPVKPTRLAVVTDPAGADVEVDGKAAGRTPFVVNDLPEGRHTVAVSLAGFTSQASEVDLQGGQSQEVRVTLVKAAVPEKAPPAAKPVAAAAKPPEPAPTAKPTPAPTDEPAKTSPSSPGGRPAWTRWITLVPGAGGVVLGLLAGVLGAALLASAYPYYFGMAAANASVGPEAGFTQRNAWNGFVGLLGGGAVMALTGAMVSVMSVLMVAVAGVTVLVLL